VLVSTQSWKMTESLHSAITRYLRAANTDPQYIIGIYDECERKLRDLAKLRAGLMTMKSESESSEASQKK
jgi:hypothetical protein